MTAVRPRRTRTRTRTRGRGAMPGFAHGVTGGALRGAASVRVLGWVALVWLASAATAQAGPWTRSPGRWYVKLAEGVFVADGFRDSGGTFNTGTTYRAYNSSLYGELGALEDLHLQLYLPFTIGANEFDQNSVLRLTTLCEGGRRAVSTQRRTFGDAQLGAQWTSPWLAFPHAARVDAKLPLYSVGEPDGQCAVLFPQPGDGQLDLDLWLSAGDSFDAGRFYAFAELGHRVRSELYFGEDMGQAFADTFLAFAQFGWQLHEGSFLMLNTRLAVPYADDRLTKGSLTVGPAAYLGLGEGFAAELAADFTPWARNSAGGHAGGLYWTAITLGVSHKYD